MCYLSCWSLPVFSQFLHWQIADQKWFRLKSFRAKSLGPASQASPVFSQIMHLFSDCENYALVANGYCNDETNNEACIYDGGDCCGACINKDHCSDCLCIGEVTDYTRPLNPLAGDGYCHDELNHADCNFDGGDCCLSCRRTTFCSDCVCHEGGEPKYENCK